MAYTTINKSTDYFNTKLYTGNGGTNALTGVGFQPDLTWMKRRDQSAWHYFTDAVRGVTKTIYSNDTSAEGTKSNGLTAFGTDGFTVGDEGDINENNGSYVAWNWKANGSGSANTDGSINSTVSVNTTAGFSIVSYTGTGATATVGHGLGVTPDVIIFKCRETATDWTTFHTSLGGANKNLSLNTSSAVGTDTDYFANTNPTSTVFSVGAASNTNRSSEGMIAYCFAEKTGYSKFGSYTGNGNANGTFVYTGFKPSFYMVKQTNASGEGWFMWDNKRSSASGANVNNRYLIANSSASDGTLGVDCDFLSNGVKTRYGSSATNTSGGTYIYMAFGQSLVGSNNVPCTAR